MARVIAIDADGVLLDYNLAYASAWKRAFGVLPRERDPLAYWAIDRWEVERLDSDGLEYFRGYFDESFWSSIPGIDEAVTACHALSAAGFELVCVTAMPPRFVEARRHNLRSLGFPIGQVIATGSSDSGGNPKTEAIAMLGAHVLVDDFLPNLLGLLASVHPALITRRAHGSCIMETGASVACSRHVDLSGFADWWLSRECDFRLRHSLGDP